MNTSTNLLFLSYGGLPRDTTSKLLQGGGGLIQGSRDIMGIKSSRVQKIWELTQEFDDSPEQKKIFSYNLYNEVPPAPPRPKVASQGNSTPQQEGNISPQQKGNLSPQQQEEKYNNKPIQTGQQMVVKSPKVSKSPLKLLKQFFYKTPPAKVAPLEPHKEPLSGTPPTPPTPNTLRTTRRETIITPPSSHKTPPVMPQIPPKTSWSITNRTDPKDDFILAFKRTKRI